MRKLIFDLLDLTRIESGEKKRELTDVDVIDVARTAMETVAADAEARGIPLELEAPEALILPGDRGELEIILNNLVSNAVKYNRDGGSVQITLKEGEGGVCIRVSDTGIGMSPAEMENLFGEFSRIKNEKTRNILGSGLGLNIVKRIAALYGGTVEAESVPDAGSTFTVVLKRSGD